MRFSNKMFFLLFLILLVADAAEGKAWRGIFPLRSTRAEVSRAFGPCVSKDDSCTYEMEGEQVKFLFVSKSCGQIRMKHPSDLVLRIEVKPKKNAKISDFINYARAVTLSIVSEKGGQEALADNEDGVAIETDGHTILSAYFTAAGKDVERCSNVHVKPTDLFPGKLVLEEFACPKISVDCPQEITEIGQPIIFSASITGGSAYLEPSYVWSVSGGRLTKGQNTSLITVDTKGLTSRQMLTATVTVAGLPSGCNRVASCSSLVCR